MALLMLCLCVEFSQVVHPPDGLWFSGQLTVVTFKIPIMSTFFFRQVFEEAEARWIESGHADTAAIFTHLQAFIAQRADNVARRHRLKHYLKAGSVRAGIYNVTRIVYLCFYFFHDSLKFIFIFIFLRKNQVDRVVGACRRHTRL